MTDDFANIVMPLVFKILEEVDALSRGASPSLEEMMAKAKIWFADAERSAESSAALSESFRLAKFALVALTDELLTDSDWGRSVLWGHNDLDDFHVLEWDLFETHDRGDSYYAPYATDAVESARLALAKAALAAKPGEPPEVPAGATDALEVYLLCVTLGFGGNLSRDHQARSQWALDTYRTIRQLNPVGRPFGAQQVPEPGSELPPWHGPALLLRVSALTAITAIATLFAYLAAVQAEFATYGN